MLFPVLDVCAKPVRVLTLQNSGGILFASFFLFYFFRLAESVTAGRGVVLPGLPYTSSRNRSLAQCRDFNIHIDHASRTFWQPGEFACVFPRIHTSVAILVVYLFFFVVRSCDKVFPNGDLSRGVFYADNFHSSPTASI